MSDEYTVNLYFSKPIAKDQQAVIKKRLNRAYFKDSIEEEHISLWDFEEEKRDSSGNVVSWFPHEKQPTFEEAFALFEEDDSGVDVEWDDDGTEATVYFSGWSCCRNAVKKEARKIMKEASE